MGTIDVAVVATLLTVLGGFAGGLVTVFGNKNQKVIDLIAERLTSAERRLDELELELARERQRRMTLAVYATAVRAWASRAWEALVHHNIDFDHPPTWDPVASEDQLLAPDVEKGDTHAKKDKEG